MSSVLEKLIKAREFSMEVDGLNLTLRRPLAAEMMKWRVDGQLTPFALALNCVVSWGELSEADLISGGNASPMEFDRDTWHEVLADRPELWAPIASAIQDQIELYQENRKTNRKNFVAASKSEAATSSLSGTAT